MKRNELVYK